jgi:hypothetical protein
MALQDPPLCLINYVQSFNWFLETHLAQLPRIKPRFIGTRAHVPVTIWTELSWSRDSVVGIAAGYGLDD